MSVFIPMRDSQTIGVTNSSQRIALSAQKALSFVKLDTGDFYVYARFGDDSVTVSDANGYPAVIVAQAVGGERIIGVPHGVTHVALITGSGTAKNIQVTEGDLLAA